MKIEVLFPEFCNIYGEMANVRYLAKSAPDAEIVYSGFGDEFLFPNATPDMIYIGAMPESKQHIAAEKLKPHKNKLMKLMEEGTVILSTGNSIELFGKYIEENGSREEMLGIFGYHGVRDMNKHHNSFFLGEYDGMKLVGNKSQFSFLRGDIRFPFMEVLGGVGSNPESKSEGINYHNFFATYLLGPFLIENPLFTKRLLGLMGHDDTLAFEEDAMKAYRFRLEKMEKPDARFIQGDHG